MLTKNEITIEIHALSAKELEAIQAYLKIRDISLFQQKVVAPLRLSLEYWIEKEYPSLVSEKEDILFGVFRRLKNKLVATDLSVKTFDIEQYVTEFLQIECQANLPNEANRKKNLGLDKAQFKKLVAALQQGDETLIEQVYLSHFSKCVSFLMMQHKCSKVVAYDCSMDALIEIRKDLLNGKIRYGNLGSYFTNRAVGKWYKRNRKEKASILPLNEELNFADTDQQEQKIIQRELTEIIANAMKKLCTECRFILKQFYYEDKNLNEIGTLMDKNHSAVRKQATRCREKLKKHIGENFYRQYTSFLKD